ncbi:MAG: Holliday junction branch migration protein RuvA [Planctomycetota bacterium]
MYDFISGTLVRCGENVAVVEVGGLGYHVTVPSPTVDSVRGQTRVRLHTTLRVRDDKLVLYGFATIEERAIFERLCTISGVGPGTALVILSGIPIDEFRAAVLHGEVKTLQRVKGIGKKTAERLILELRDVLAAEPVGPTPTRRRGGQKEEDAIGALVALGFPAGHAEEAVRSALRELPDDATLEQLIKVSSRN